MHPFFVVLWLLTELLLGFNNAIKASLSVSLFHLPNVHLNRVVNHATLVPYLSISLFAVVVNLNVINHLEEVLEGIESDMHTPIPSEAVLIDDRRSQAPIEVLSFE